MSLDLVALCCGLMHTYYVLLTLITGMMVLTLSCCMWTLTTTLFCTDPYRSCFKLFISYSRLRIILPASSSPASSSTSNIQSNTSWILELRRTNYFISVIYMQIVKLKFTTKLGWYKRHIQFIQLKNRPFLVLHM